MRALVTGGAGYIGSAVATALIGRGDSVVVLDDFSTGHRDAVPEDAELVEGSVLDAESVRVSIEGVDAVLHFAAKSLVGESMTDPGIYWRTNVCGTLNLLEAVCASSASRLIFSSTAAVYGEPLELPIRETADTRPTSPYGASKLAADLLIGNVVTARGIAATSLRYFNVAGSFGDLGERHPVETHLIPLTLQVARGQRQSLDIYGSDYDTPDGTAIRDYIHLEDLADAHLLALDASEPGVHSIFNLGNGRGYSVLEVLEACRRVTGMPIDARSCPRRPGDPARLVASSDRAEASLGWRPKKPAIDEIVGDAWRTARRF